MRVLAVDPGVSTGLALYENLAGREVFKSWTEPEPMAAIDRVRLEVLEGLDALVCESFQLSMGTLKKTQAGTLVTVEMIGALRWIAHKRGTLFVLQAPRDAREFSTRKRLQAVGLWRDSDHARSAARHLVLYLVRTGALNPLTLIGS